jgi:SynChlorMet cassette protein ScmC
LSITLKLTDRPSPDSKVVLRANFNDYVLLFQPLFADVIGLSPIALETWRLLDGQLTVAEVVDLVRTSFDGAPENVSEDVVAFLSELIRRGFILTEPELQADTGDLSPSHPVTPSPSHPVTPSPSHPVTLSPRPSFSLALADGSHFTLQAGDEEAGRVVDQFAVSARLAPATGTPAGHPLLVATEEHAAPVGVGVDAACIIQSISTAKTITRASGRGALISKTLSETEWLWQQLVRLSAFIGKETQAHGGVLLHSALASYSPGEGRGVLLAGRSGVGKTTACTRLPDPWRALSDDMTLLVRDHQGAYWAHPWPTWSRLFSERKVDDWDMQTAVPLKAIFILDQAVQDQATPAGGGEAVCLLMELARQSARYLWKNVGQDALYLYHNQRFDNVCALVQAVPAYLLNVSLEGTFWKEMEKVLGV